MALTLGNAMRNTAANAITTNQLNLKSSGKSLATGYKDNLDPVSHFMGKSFGDQKVILKTVNESMAYGKNALNVASYALGSMATTVSDMLSTIVRATGNSDANLDALNSMFLDYMGQLDSQRDNASFNGRPLLNGDLGQDPTIRSNFNRSVVSVKSSPAQTNGFAYVTGNVAGKRTITAAAVNVNDTVTVNGITIMAAAGEVLGAVGAGTDRFDQGTDDNTTAASIVNVFQHLQNNGTAQQQADLANYNFQSNGAVVEITQIVGEGSFENIAASIDNGRLALGVAGADANNVAPAQISKATATFTGALNNGDTITINSVKFKAVTGEPDHTKNEFKIANNRADLARNLASAISRATGSSGETLQGITSTVAGDQVVIENVGVGNNGITILSSTHAVTTTSTKGTKTIDLSGITKNVSSFASGASKASFNFVRRDTSINAGKLAADYGHQTAAGNNNAADEVAIYSAMIGGRTFEGAVFKPNGGNMFNTEIKMIDKSSGDFFILNGGPAFDSNIDTAANSTALATRMQGLFAGTAFNETKTLKINTEKGDVHFDGNVIASTKGTTVRLTASDFDQLTFKDFKIEQVGGNLRFTAIIEGKDPQNPQTYVADAVNINDLVQGFKLNLTDAVSGNVLSINLGEKGLTSLHPTNFATVANAYKAMMLNSGDGLQIRTGLDFEHVLTINFGDVSSNKLFVNNKGEYIKNLNIRDRASALVAQEVCTNALRIVRAEEQKNTSSKALLQKTSDTLRYTIQITEETEDSYLLTDLMEAASDFSESLKRMIAAMSTAEAGSKVSDTALRIIQSIG